MIKIKYRLIDGDYISDPLEHIDYNLEQVNAFIEGKAMHVVIYKIEELFCHCGNPTTIIEYGEHKTALCNSCY